MAPHLHQLNRTGVFCRQFLAARVVVILALLPLGCHLHGAIGGALRAEAVVTVPVSVPGAELPEGWWRRPLDLAGAGEVPWAGTQFWSVSPAPSWRHALLWQVDSPCSCPSAALDRGRTVYVAEWVVPQNRVRLLRLTRDNAPEGETLRKEVVCVIRAEPGQEAVEFCAARTVVSPNGQYVVCPLPDPGVALVNVVSGQVVARYPEAFDPVWSPDGRRLLLRSERRIKGMLLVDVASPADPATIPGEVAYQPARTGRHDQWFWQLQWHKRPARAGGFEVTPVLVRYHPSGGVRIVNTLWPLRLPEAIARHSVYLLDPPSDSDAIVLVRTATGTGEIWAWKANSQAPLRRLVEIPLPIAPRAPLWLEDGQRLLWIGSYPGVPAWLDPATLSLYPAIAAEPTETFLLAGAVQSCARSLQGCRDQFPDPVTELLHWPTSWQLRQVQDVRGVPEAFQDARRLARSTLRILGRYQPSRSDSKGPQSIVRFRLEARMWLSYLAEDYGETLNLAGVLDAHLHEQLNREALVLVRLYSLLGAGRFAEARAMLGALDRLPGDWADSQEMARALREISRYLDNLPESEHPLQ